MSIGWGRGFINLDPGRFLESQTMKFAEAKHVKMTFGQHKDQTIDEIAKSDAGLAYLDWVRSIAYGRIKDAIEAYPKDPAIDMELHEILERRDD